MSFNNITICYRPPKNLQCIISPTTTQMVANRSFCVTLTFAGKDNDSSGYDLKDKNNVTDVAKRIRDSALDYYSTYY